MVVLLLFLGGFPSAPAQFYLFMAIAGLLDALAFLSILYALRHAPLSLVSPISAFNPVFTTFFAMVFLREVPHPLKFLGVVIIVLGTYLLNVSDIKQGIWKPFVNVFANRGVQLALFTNFLWGITPVFQKQAIFLTTPETPLYASFIGTIFMTLFILPFTLKQLPKAVKPTQKNLGSFLVLGIFIALSQYAAYTAFSLTNVGYVSAVFKLSTLFTILLGVFFFKEKRIAERLLGATVMVFGTLLLIL